MQRTACLQRGNSVMRSGEVGAPFTSGLSITTGGEDSPDGCPGSTEISPRAVDSHKWPSRISHIDGETPSRPSITRCDSVGV